MLFERTMLYEHSAFFEQSNVLRTILSSLNYSAILPYSNKAIHMSLREAYNIELVFDNLLAMRANYCICQKAYASKTITMYSAIGWIQRASAFEKAVITANDHSN